MEKHAPLKRIVFLCTLILALAPTAWPRIIYVDDNATGLNDGSSWANAYSYLQDALADLARSQEKVEVRVAGGVYGTTTLWVTRDVVLRGGYAGSTMPDPDARDVNDYPTTITGDGTGRGLMHVRDANIMVDGFTMTGGYYNIGEILVS
jgi:hypothetical protein